MAAVAQDVRPEVFGRYVLLDRIGEGGMAEVFRAIMPGAEGFKRTFVIKRILASLGQSAKFVDMFVREARIGAMLNHPNIVQVYDFGSVDGHYFLAMEYLRGRDVLEIIRRVRDMKQPFPIPVAAYVAHEVAAGLGHAHGLTGPDGRSLDIIHRDVSPSNVMCLREGGVKLLDFGIASALSEAQVENTAQGTFKGKLAYMAPERLRNEPLDGRCDLYSLGVVLWEMLTCRRLFRGASEAETFKNVLEMPIPPPSKQRPEVPPSLDALVLRALARDREKRYESGQAFADDLEEVMRETKWKSRMLPGMLSDLFGSSIHSSQIALSSLTPEMLAAVGAGTGTGSLIGAAAPAAKPLLSTWRFWVAVVVVFVVAGLGLSFGLRFGRVTPPPPLASQPVGVAPPAPEPPASPPPATVVASGPAAVDSVPAAAEPAKKPGLGKKPSRAATRKPDRPIVRGLSIDPFAEAAKRKPR